MKQVELLMDVTFYVKLYRVTSDTGDYAWDRQHYDLIDHGGIRPYEVLSLRTVDLILDYIYENLGWLSDTDQPLSDAEWILERGA